MQKRVEKKLDSDNLTEKFAEILMCEIYFLCVRYIMMMKAI